jgi:hypothetical protein
MQTKSFLGIITVMAALLYHFRFMLTSFSQRLKVKQLLPKPPKFRKLNLQLKE